MHRGAASPGDFNLLASIKLHIGEVGVEGGGGEGGGRSSNEDELLLLLLQLQLLLLLLVPRRRLPLSINGRKLQEGEGEWEEERVRGQPVAAGSLLVA